MLTHLRLTDANFKSRTDCDAAEFKPGVNLLVGGNGSGKSTILEAIRREIADNNQRTAILTRDNAPIYFYFGEAATAKSTGAGDEGDLTVVRQSHGQRMTSYLNAIRNLDGEATVILDEPELALDFFAVMELARALALKPSVQSIIATHHPVLFTIKGANIINLDHTRSNYVRDVLTQMGKRLGK